MVDYQKAKDFLEYARQDQIKKFGTDELLLPFEPRFPTDTLRNIKTFGERILNKKDSST